MALKVNERSEAVNAMAVEWTLTEALMGGTKAMRAAGEAFLPKWSKEERDTYEARLKSATLFPAFKRTVGVMAGKPFSKRLQLKEVSARIQEICDKNIDNHGTNLHAWAASAFKKTLAHGIAGCLIDYPVTRDAEGKPLLRTRADEKAAGVQPYFVFIAHKQILGWLPEIKNGKISIAMLRLLECVEEPDGEFGTVKVEQVRVLKPGIWEVWREKLNKDGKKEWVIHEQGTTTIKRVPFVPFYGESEHEFMVSRSPLIDLGYQNVKHWQSQSDQDTILHVARVPVLVMTGVDPRTDSITIGASTASKFSNPQAKVGYVEHTGKAIESGQVSIDKLEEQMVQTGAELLVKQEGQRTATESAGDQEGNKSELQMIVEQFEDSLDQCLEIMGEWIGEEKTGEVELFKNFSTFSISDASAQVLLSWQQGGLITKKTAIIEAQRRNFLNPDLDPEEELTAVEEEGPALSAGSEEIDPATGLPRQAPSGAPAPGPGGVPPGDA